MNNKVLLSLVLLSSSLVALSSCSSSGIEYEEIKIDYSKINDNYRSIYQIMPYSFSDSNGDGIGDLRGIIDKLDYIESLNYSGLWLTPIHPSETYHKYDVDNYKEIDRTFGTLEDYDELVRKCHEKNMTILMDGVFNHSSDTNKWFTNCISAHLGGRSTNKYYNYYNIYEDKGGGSVPTGYVRYGTSNLYYEARFWSGMPDLNLQNVLDEPNGNLANDLKDVFKFWLVDHDIDGFRLDAVTSYFSTNQDKDIEFLTWLNTECKKLKPNCYIVGEGSWDNNQLNSRFQTSGVDSFFNFSNQAAKGYVASIVMGDASFYPYALKKNKETANGGIEAPFVANHDTGHMIGAVKGRSSVNNLKFGHGVLAMLNGTTYTYNGDEYGLAVPSGGDGRDENKRLPMNFGDKYNPKPVATAQKFAEEDIYPYGSVANQLKDKNSVINYVKKANLLRKQFPSIARGAFSELFTSADETFTVVKKTYQDETILICMNASPSYSYTYNFASTGFSKPVAELCCKDFVKLNGDKELVIPAQGIVILK